jgi:hypothetical protein
MSIEQRLKPAEQRLATLEQRRVSHKYIPGTKAFDEAIYAFFFRVKARCGCTSCLQAGDADDNTHCISGCKTWEDAERDEAAILNRDNMLERILYEHVTMEK